MKLFLTSVMGENYWEDGVPKPQMIPEVNNWRATLKKELSGAKKGLLIAATPDAYDMNDGMRNDMQEALKMTEIPIDGIDICDNRNPQEIKPLLEQADFVVLSGGHVPTQNAFFVKIGLKELIHKFDGVVIGISAGTMNCADIVYACPEEEGESIDPEYKRYIPGLGLTTINVLPHYQHLKDVILDGVRMVDDIALKDSYNKSFIALVDGSYICVENGKSVIYGEAYRAYNGKMEKICEVNEKLELNGDML